MRVVVAEDVMLTRAGIVSLLRESGVEVVAEAEDGASLLAAIRATAPDVAISDIRMPPTHRDEGLVAAARIRAEHPGTGVLLLSQYLESDYAMELLATFPGGIGYLLKDRVFDIAVVLDALRRISEGECVIDPTIISRLMTRPRPADDPVSALSPREREVLGLLAEGRSNEGIGAALYVTPRTVESHISEIFAKLDLEASSSSNRRVLAVLAYLKAAL